MYFCRVCQRSICVVLAPLQQVFQILSAAHHHFIRLGKAGVIESDGHVSTVIINNLRQGAIVRNVRCCTRSAATIAMRFAQICDSQAIIAVDIQLRIFVFAFRNQHQSVHCALAAQLVTVFTEAQVDFFSLLLIIRTHDGLQRTSLFVIGCIYISTAIEHCTSVSSSFRNNLHHLGETSLSHESDSCDVQGASTHILQAEAGECQQRFHSDVHRFLGLAFFSIHGRISHKQLFGQHAIRIIYINRLFSRHFQTNGSTLAAQVRVVREVEEVVTFLHHRLRAPAGILTLSARERIVRLDVVPHFKLTPPTVFTPIGTIIREFIHQAGAELVAAYPLVLGTLNHHTCFGHLHIESHITHNLSAIKALVVALAHKFLLRASS